MVLMDIQMPVLGGIDATKIIRQSEPASLHTPIIALTANALKGQAEEYLAAGMDHCLTKPIDTQALYQIIKRYSESGSV